MDWRYPTKYSDQHGTEVTELRNDGENLSVRLRGIRFVGHSFDMFEPEPNCAPELLRNFSFWKGTLCDYTLECEIPLPVVSGGETLMASLKMRLELASPIAGSERGRELLSLSLKVKDHVYDSAGTSGCFEDELLSLQSRLPAGDYLKACITCAYSDYSPYGHGLFGWMACYRNFKQEYAKVTGKDGLFQILNQADVVQETYLCQEFEKRRPHTGYRG